MKKTLALALSTLLIFMTACSHLNTSSEEGISLYQRGLDLIAEIDYMADHEDTYQALLPSLPDPDKDELLASIRAIRGQDHQSPAQVYEVENIEESLFAYYSSAQDISLSAPAKDLLRDRLILAFPHLLTSADSRSVNDLILANILNRTKAFKANMEGNAKLYLYSFDQADYIFVLSFTNQSHGVVSATASIVFNQEIAAGASQEDLEEYIKGLGFDQVRLKPVNK